MAKKFICNACGQTFEAEAMPDKCPICGAPASAIEEAPGQDGAGAKPARKGLDTNSNAYTIVYAAVMVVIVAFLLAFVSSALKPVQEANVENDVKGQILTALGYDKASVDVAKTFASKVRDNVWDGSALAPYRGGFNTAYGALIKKGELHVFTATTADGKAAYVIPVTGRGLWGGLWGYIALNEDCRTVYGTYFYHEGETAGLGARIGERAFQKAFEGRPLFQGDDTSCVALTVVKSGQASGQTQVDGITGATLTSKGVAAMVGDGLGAYLGFIHAMGAPSDSDVECEADTLVYDD